jgi:hypothetical protein
MVKRKRPYVKRPRLKRLPRDQKELDFVRNQIIEKSEHDYAIFEERPEWDKGPCWMWKKRSGTRDYGIYGQLGENLANRVSFRVFVKDGQLLDKGRIVCHHCDRPGCVNPDHLFEGSHQDNTDDMWAKGRKARGIDYRSEDGLRRHRESITGDKSPTKRPEVAAKISAGVKEFYKTHSRDPKLIRRIAIKVANARRKIPFEDYDKICQLRASGKSCTEIAENYGVVRDRIGHIYLAYQRKLARIVFK